ncbi:MAG: thioesterase domain-containing protein, partial [Verrucomicrobiota bacterium]
RQPLFDTLFVYANNPLDLSASRPSPLKKNITLTSFESSLTSTYPLTIGVRSGSPFIAEARFQTPRVSPEEATQILERYKNLATDILAAPPQTTVADLLKDPAPFRPRTNPITPATAAVTPPPFEPPATALEAELAGIWLDLIDVDRVGRNDNFFDLGGQSLTIPRLINHIEKTTGANLPLGIIFQAPTLAQLAAAISHAKTRSQTQESTGGVMVEIHAGHSAPALFATAGGVGVEEELLVFGALIPFLPNETPIYGFRSGALDDPPPASFDDLVNRNLKELQERQPIGPYLIAGECISGPIAFEMARRLHNNGHEVARLILLDSKCPQKEDFIRQRDHGLPDLEAVQGPARARQIQNYYLNILGAEHSPYKGAVDLIVSDDSREQFGDSLGWQDYLTGPCRIHKVPGDHDSYIRTHNAEVGRCLNQILRDVLTITSS